MATEKYLSPNPKLDLVLERTVDVDREAIWRAWTTPERLMPWFCPQPWKTIECEIDLRPGGVFRTVMQSPEGERFPNLGCYLEVIPQEKLVWTSALGPGYRPAAQTDLSFTAILLLEARGQSTQYTAIAIHPDEATRNKHEQMGFHQGWGIVLDQLVAMVKQGR